jgi:DNA topoisomerase-1
MPLKTKKEKKIKNLVIVESPTKAKTIGGFLGKEYIVESSYGHIRDLPKSKLGVDVEKNFEPQYIIPKKVQKRANNLKKISLRAENIILATDEDREGEAIAWHLTKLLDIDKYSRIVFHEITPEAIKESLNNPRKIKEELVNAQQARRVLDRLVGYQLSPFLWKKVRRGLSAGRVQSVALKIICEREKEREDFVKEEYWTIESDFSIEKKEEKLKAELVEIGKEALKKFSIKNEKEAEDIKKDILGGDRMYSISKITKKETKKYPLPPFTTSTLQQEANKRLGFSSKQTMVLAQKLYEGLNIGSKKSVGLITYMRTDSFNLSKIAIDSGRRVIEKEFGKEFLPEKEKIYKKKSKMAQEAHEAIRPTNPEIIPETIKDKLEPNLFKIYQLIWTRFIACQMKEAIFERTNISLSGKGKKEEYLFKANGNILQFKGFLSVYPIKFQEQELPILKEKQKLEISEIFPIQHFTQPPARYNEASLIKTLEENGIGRPSTYAPTISVLQNRFYIEKDEERRFYPTELGNIVNNILVQHFPKIVDVNFTAEIESDFDKIATGKEKWQEIVKEFYNPFKENLEKKYQEVKKEEIEEKTDEVCEKCGKPMLVKWSKFGKFLGCSGFPECKTIKKIKQKNDVEMKCPKCQEGDVITRRTKAKKRLFYGCSKWPECDFVSWKKPTEEKKEKEKKEEENEEKKE